MGGTVRIAAGSIVVGIAVLGIKYLAYAVTGSVALYSDALESLVNVVTAIAALIAVHVSEQPADFEPSLRSPQGRILQCRSGGYADHRCGDADPA